MSYLDNMFGLQGKVAAVIGGGGVLAGAMAKGLAQAGADIVTVLGAAEDMTIAETQEFVLRSDPGIPAGFIQLFPEGFKQQGAGSTEFPCPVFHGPDQCAAKPALRDLRRTGEFVDGSAEKPGTVEAYPGSAGGGNSLGWATRRNDLRRRARRQSG